MPAWPTVDARVIPGHGVASGRAGDPRFPGGTIRMQLPHFQARGLDLSGFHPATLNCSIAPCRFALREPRLTLRSVDWHAAFPPEDFSFVDCRVHPGDGAAVAGLIYYPHPETKPDHVQPPDVLEVLTRFLPGLAYGDHLTLAIDPAQLTLMP